MRVAVLAATLALVAGCGGKGRSAGPGETEALIPVSPDVAEKRRRWRARWKRKRSFSLAVEFLRLYASDGVRKATTSYSGGREHHTWTGWQAEADLTTDQAEELLGGQDDSTDFTRDVRISETEWIKIEDHEAAGDGADAKPVNVKVLRLSPSPSGTGTLKSK